MSNVSIVEVVREPYFNPEAYKWIQLSNPTKSIRKNAGNSVFCNPAFVIQCAYFTPSLATMEKVFCFITLFSMMGFAT